MKKLLLLLLISLSAFAQNTTRKYLSHTWKNNILEVKTSDGNYRILPYADKIVETSFIPTGETFQPVSHAVVKSPEKIKPELVNTANSVILHTKKITVLIQKSPFGISYQSDKKLLFAEKSGYFKQKHQPLEHVKGNIVYDSTEVIQFQISPEEQLFGGGARALGMNRRGNRLALYNRAHYGYETRAELMNFCIPMVLSSKRYAIHFDNPAIGYLDLDSQKNNTLSYETISGRKTYQVIVGDSWDDLVAQYTDLTGRQPLPPRWSLGNFSSRFGYRSQDAVEGTVRKFEEAKLPVDGLILDLYWFGKTIKGTMGNLDWDRDNFPEPEKMIARLNAKNIQTILITEPFILTTSSKWKEAVKENILVTDAAGKPATWDFYFGNTGVVDVFKPQGRNWYWDIYKKLVNQGVGGIWGDLGEPEVFPAFVRTAGGTADEVHNIYGHQWAKMIAEGYAKDFPEQRPFILMRAGYSGSQRFGMLPWSGDVNRTWGGLQSQMEISLQMGMQGMAYMHSDLGGFAGDYYDNELYLRWLQYGVFNPIFRPHAQEEVASEIARKDIVTREKARVAVNLRYQLLPYNYTLAYENSTTGKPLMRPLFFEEPDNKALYAENESYLWGSDFLIRPITKANVTSSEVYFPKKSNWFDFYTGKKYLGGTTATVAVTETAIPTFVRGGSFIPMIEPLQNTSDYTLKKLDLHYFHEEESTISKGKIYYDDGKNPKALEQKSFEIIYCSAENKATTTTLTITASSDPNFVVDVKNITLKVHQLPIKKAMLNGKPVAFQTNENTTSIFLSLGKNESLQLVLEK